MIKGSRKFESERTGHPHTLSASPRSKMSQVRCARELAIDYLWTRSNDCDRPSAFVGTDPGLRPVQEIAVPLAAALERARLGLEIDIRQAAAAQVAFRPFEVIQQAPGEVAFHRHARVARSAHRLQVAFEV